LRHAAKIAAAYPNGTTLFAYSATREIVMSNMSKRYIAVPALFIGVGLAACGGDPGSSLAEMPTGNPAQSTNPNDNVGRPAEPSSGNAGTTVTPVAASYSVVDLGTLGGQLSQAVSINSAGVVAGVSAMADDARHAFIYEGGSMTELGTLGGSISVGYSINANGAVTGYSTLPTGSYRAFLYANGQMTNLGAIGGADYSSAAAVNARGDVVGESAIPNSDRHEAFVYSDGAMVDLGTLGGEYSAGHGINDADQIVGYSSLSDGSFHGFLVSGGRMTDLGTLGGTYSKAYAINAAGQIVGQGYLPGDAKAHAFLYQNGTMTDLDTLGSVHSEALSISASGVVVGDYETPGDDVVGLKAFVFVDGQMKDLNELILPGSGWHLNVASGINDRGQIVGSGELQGQQHAFLLNP
jgi:probable HAF family extracellular repeat protein